MTTLARKPESRVPVCPSPPIRRGPIDVWMEDGHLVCEHNGTLWLKWFPSRYDDFPPLRLGNAAEGVDWPEQLGEEPRWWITEVAYLTDLWEDSRR